MSEIWIETKEAKVLQSVRFEKEDVERIERFNKKEAAEALATGREPPKVSETVRRLLRKGLSDSGF